MKHEANPPNSEERMVSLITAARSGCSESLGELVEACRPYLLLIANQEIGDRLKAKVGASDIVQETLLQVRRDIGSFQGRSKSDLLSWLRKVLLHEVIDTHRHYKGTQKRDINLEQSIPTDSVIARQPQYFVSRQLTPSSEATAREEALVLRQALSKLPQEFVTVIKLRNWQQLSWEQVGERMGRTSEAARKLWGRAVAKLKSEIVGNDRPPNESTECGI